MHLWRFSPECCCLTCVLKVSDVVKDFPHSTHLNWILSCFFRWTLRWLDVVNCLLHTQQTNGFSFVCTLMCVTKPPDWVKLLLQTVQEYGLIPVLFAHELHTHWVFWTVYYNVYTGMVERQSELCGDCSDMFLRKKSWSRSYTDTSCLWCGQNSYVLAVVSLFYIPCHKLYMDVVFRYSVLSCGKPIDLDCGSLSHTLSRHMVCFQNEHFHVFYSPEMSYIISHTKNTCTASC